MKYRREVKSKEFVLIGCGLSDGEGGTSTRLVEVIK